MTEYVHRQTDYVKTIPAPLEGTGMMEVIVIVICNLKQMWAKGIKYFLLPTFLVPAPLFGQHLRIRLWFCFNCTSVILWNFFRAVVTLPVHWQTYLINSQTENNSSQRCRGWKDKWYYWQIFFQSNYHSIVIEQDYVFSHSSVSRIKLNSFHSHMAARHKCFRMCNICLI